MNNRQLTVMARERVSCGVMEVSGSLEKLVILGRSVLHLAILFFCK